MGVTAHFINAEFVMIRRTLALKYLEDTHTGDNIYNQLCGIFAEWGIEDKVTHIVTDGAANMKAAISKFKHIIHLPCAAHRLNLCVNDLFK